MSDTKATTPTISVAEVAERVERNEISLLDIRRTMHGEQIYGAINYDPKKLTDAARLVLPLPKSEGLIVIYDESGSSRELEEVAEKLRTDGYATVRALEGGFKAWKAANGKLEDETLEQPVPLVSEHQVER